MFGLDDAATAALISGGFNFGGDIFGMFGPGESYPGGRAIGRPEWWAAQGDIIGGAQGARNFANQITPEYLGALRNALSGNMGLSPEVIQMMFGRQQQAMRPQFAQQQDTLRASFSPRLAGSGAAGSAMQNLLSGQSQAMTGALTDINIQDLLGRFGTQQQALGQFGQLWGGSQAAQNAAQNAWLRWLGM